MRSRSTSAPAIRRSSPSLTKSNRLMRSGTHSVMLSLTLRSSSSACDLRSSGAKPMPAAIASAGLRSRTGRPSTATVPRERAIVAEDRLGQFRAAGADQAREADDLAGADFEADIA